MSIGGKVYRIKSRSRFIFFVMLLLLILTSMMNLAMGLGDVSSLTAETFEEVLIGSGDTLWQIASEYAGESQDVRELIHQICKINDISADSIYPGQLIRIPVQS